MMNTNAMAWRGTGCVGQLGGIEARSKVGVDVIDAGELQFDEGVARRSSRHSNVCPELQR